MAHRKAGGSTKLGRDSKSKRLGVKLFGGQKVDKNSLRVEAYGKADELNSMLGVIISVIICLRPAGISSKSDKSKSP